jgi:hypothetical protein
VYTVLARARSWVDSGQVHSNTGMARQSSVVRGRGPPGRGKQAASAPANENVAHAFRMHALRTPQYIHARDNTAHSQTAQTAHTPLGATEYTTH